MHWPTADQITTTTVSVIYIGVIYVHTKYYAKWWPLALEHCVVIKYLLINANVVTGCCMHVVFCCRCPSNTRWLYPPSSLRQRWALNMLASPLTNSSVVGVYSHTCRCLWLVYLQIDWLNAYHAECLDKIGGYLADQGKTEALQWLQRETKPVGWSILELWYSPSIQFLIIGTG